jgi:steroid 5-alpha reductase family enzyme
MFHFVTLLGINLLVIEAFMILLWIIYILLKRNVNLVDIGWGISFIIAAVVDFSLGEGFLWRRVLMLSLVLFWATRLIYILVQRYDPNKEDPRYQNILQSPLFMGPIGMKVLALYLIQGLIATLLTLPFALMSDNTLPFFCPIEVLGILIWVVGMIGETVADNQLALFKQDPMNEGKVLDQGLWRYTRHPNYFFEWIIWIGFSLMALSSQYGWLGLLSPIIMLFLLLKISGIPATEAHSLESKGEAYSEYQRKTSAFFPWFKW